MNDMLPRWLLSIRLVFVGLACFLAIAQGAASSAAEAADKAAVLGQPAALQVQPQSITLRGRHANQQIVVTGEYAGGVIRDLTGVCEMSSEAAEIAAIDETGYVTPKKNGQTALVIKAGDKTRKAVFTYERSASDQLKLNGTMAGHTIQMQLRREDEKKFLLSSRGFHWVQEYPFNR